MTTKEMIESWAEQNGYQIASWQDEVASVVTKEGVKRVEVLMNQPNAMPTISVSESETWKPHTRKNLQLIRG
jgi:hypothetical protein